MKILDTLIDQVSGSFLNYLHLGAWLDQKITSRLSGRQRRDFLSIKDFWEGIFSEEIHAGDRVRFNEAFITEWFPRLPGQAWFMECHKQLGRRIDLEQLREGRGFFSESVLDTHSLDPFGVVRLPFGENKLHYAAVSITTADSWYCDLGVPVIFSSSVYDAFLRQRVERNAVETTIEGTVQFGRIPLLNTDFLKSVGSEIDKTFLERISTTLNFPEVYIQVASPLDATFRTHNTHPPGFLWAIEREVRNAKVIYHVGDEPADHRVEVIPCENYITYGLLTAHTQLQHNDEILSVVEAFKTGESLPLHKFSDMTRHKHGKISVDVLTEFDSRNRYFAASIPLEKEPWKLEDTKEEIDRTFTELQRASSSL